MPETKTRGPEERKADMALQIFREKLERDRAAGVFQPPPGTPARAPMVVPSVRLPAPTAERTPNAYGLGAARARKKTRQERYEELPIPGTDMVLYVLAMNGEDDALITRWNKPFADQLRAAPKGQKEEVQDAIAPYLTYNRFMGVCRDGPGRHFPHSFAPELADDPDWMPDAERHAELRGDPDLPVGLVSRAVQIAYRLSQVFDPTREDLELFFRATQRFFPICASLSDGDGDLPTGFREALKECVSLAARLSMHDPSQFPS